MSEKAARIIRYLDKRTPAVQERILQELADRAEDEERREMMAAEREQAKQKRIEELTETVNKLGSEVEKSYKIPGNFNKTLEIARQYTKASDALRDLQDG
jgi:predicted transposase YdaD